MAAPVFASDLLRPDAPKRDESTRLALTPGPSPDDQERGVHKVQLYYFLFVSLLPELGEGGAAAPDEGHYAVKRSMALTTSSTSLKFAKTTSGSCSRRSSTLKRPVATAMTRASLALAASMSRGVSPRRSV